VAPLGTPSAKIADIVSKMRPQGMTPITDALRHAATQLSADRPATIVLVSDGIETCKGDPCARAKELASKGARLVIHTVGFGVSGAAVQQLQCIAQGGGGNYYHATDGASLAKALSAVREAVVEQKPAPPPPPPPTALVAPAASSAAAKSTTIRIAGPGTIQLKPASWVKWPIYRWQAVMAETGEEKGQTRDLSQRLPAGEYRIVWRQTEHQHADLALTTIINLASSQTVEIPIDTGLRITLPQGMKAPYPWSLRAEGEANPIITVRNTLDPQVLPAGRYMLDWHENEHASTKMSVAEIDIAPGKLNDYVLNRGIQVQLADWIPGQPYRVVLAEPGGKEVGYWKSSGVHIAPPGKYKLLYWQSEHRHNALDWGDVTVPEDGFAAVAINSGVKFIAPPNSKVPYRAYFVNLDTKKEYRWAGSREFEPIPLPPGRYRLDWHENEHRTKRLTLAEEFNLDPGVLLEIQM
jgi:Ca-activated chloride channel family protein